MEHLVQFGVNVDDEAIQRTIIRNVSTQLEKKIGDNVQKAFFYKYYGDARAEFTKAGEEIIRGWMNEHKDEIISLVSKNLAEYLKRTKAVKEAVARITEEGV